MDVVVLVADVMAIQMLATFLSVGYMLTALGALFVFKEARKGGII